MRRHDESGFSLIELAISLGLFAVAVVGLTLLFDQAVESSTRVRFDEVGKTLAQRKLEEIRALPFHVPRLQNTGDVDILDLYFPGTSGGSTPTGAVGSYDATANVWTYSSTEADVVADGRRFTRVVAVQFVGTLDSGALQPTAPPAGYNSKIAGQDTPVTDAVKVTVTVSRNLGGQSRSTSIDTVVYATEQTQPSVDATGSITGASVSGLTFQDGVPAEILADLGKGSIAFREVSGSTSQASADPVQIVERDPDSGTPLQPEGPTLGQSSASVPNSTTGTVQSTSASIPAGAMISGNGDVIADWSGTSPSSATEARVSFLHSLSPEGRATVSAGRFQLNARDDGESVPLQMLVVGAMNGSVQQQSTQTQASVSGVVNLTPQVAGNPAVTLWASRTLGSAPTFRGVITIGSLHVDASVVAGVTTSSTQVTWTVERLRVWDPAANLGLGGYGPAYTFGFQSSCGGWEDDPTTPLVTEGPNSSPVRCGATRVDTTKQPFENPNPVIIPQAYAGTDALGAPGTSLSIVAGVTVQDKAADPAAGVSNAFVAQKNVLSITTRDDLAGAELLEPMLVGLGDVNVSVSYIRHEH